MIRMLLPVLLLAVLVLLVLASARSARRPPALEQVPADDHRAEAVRRARERLRRAQERYAARVSTAEEALARARQDVEVLSLGEVVLGRCTVLVAGREHELTADTRFELTHEGSVTYRVEHEGGASRIVGDDRRSGRLVVSGSGWEEAVDVIPADLPEAERLVAAGQAAARSVTVAQRERAERVERAWAELEEARSARAEVDEARLTLEDLRGSGPWVWDVPEPPEEE
ncbi:hypothetical protein [Ornithinimicrobium pekingense]|uniref:DUF4230 domain-containing protein n=1 Tax=Ornithinimicrobium pekingense TaxID=384677 RepID=A0ABQ2F585_9MICO|nr:hypothetical protein [Ornithinimicrobium pekingense]GGK60342.1 hypothetical protein GCM10011509_05860 [Ornithinimicrobium pekingense]